jgi:hypothetical protein
MQMFAKRLDLGEQHKLLVDLAKSHPVCALNGLAY